MKHYGLMVPRILIVSLMLLVQGVIKVHSAHLTTIFAHGVLGNEYNVLWYAPPVNPEVNSVSWHIIETPYYSFNFPDVPPGKKDMPILSNINIGQDLDIQTLASNVEKVIATRCTNPDDGIILIGYSRGAITIFNFLAILSVPATDPFYTILSLTTQQRQHILGCIKAVILEAPVETPQEFTKAMHNLLGSYYGRWTHYFSYVIPTIFHRFSSYNPQGIHPIDVINDISTKIPMLFVHATTDEINPISSSENLYNELKKTGHDVYFLKLNAGKHGKYNLGQDAYGYMAGVHAFYDILGLPHDQQWVEEGMKRLQH